MFIPYIKYVSIVIRLNIWMASLRVGDRVDDTSVVLDDCLPKYEKTIFIIIFYFLYIFQELSMMFGHMYNLVLNFFFWVQCYS